MNAKLEASIRLYAVAEERYQMRKAELQMLLTPLLSAMGVSGKLHIRYLARASTGDYEIGYSTHENNCVEHTSILVPKVIMHADDPLVACRQHAGAKRQLDKLKDTISKRIPQEGEKAQENMSDEHQSFTCPRCKRTSYNPYDAQYGYCGFCRTYTREDQPSPEGHISRGTGGGKPDGPG